MWLAQLWCPWLQLWACGFFAAPQPLTAYPQPGPRTWEQAIDDAWNLSKAEGLEQCYLKRPKGRGNTGPLVSVFSCNGYRLPTKGQVKKLGLPDVWIINEGIGPKTASGNAPETAPTVFVRGHWAPLTPDLLKVDGQTAHLSFEAAAKALNEQSKAEGLQSCYLIEPQIGGKNPVSNPFDACDGYQFPTFATAMTLGIDETFWLWDQADSPEHRKLWTSGSAPIESAHPVLLYRPD